jgi:uncharacterized protein (TIGR03083 family)
MTQSRTFAAWIAPLAEKLRDDRRRVLEFARSAPDDFWKRPAPNEGWTNKDLLAHIGRGNDQIVQQLLRTIASGERIDTTMFAIDNDAANEEGIAARREQPVAGVIAELEESGEEMQELLSQLTEAHEHLRQDDPPFHVEGFLKAVSEERHDIEHLHQLEAALEGVR